MAYIFGDKAIYTTQFCFLSIAPFSRVNETVNATLDRLFEGLHVLLFITCDICEV